MALGRRRFTKDFKLQVLLEVEAGKPLAQASREHQVHACTIIAWRKQHEQYAEQAFQGNGCSYTDTAKISELERKIGQLTMENDLLKKALLRLEGRIPRAGGNGSGR